jgi:hypothetical protein
MAAIFKDLQYFSLQLKRAGIIHALGGSGLLRLRGIDVPVNDWDITTDAEEAVIMPLTVQFEGRRLSASQQFRSEYLYKFSVNKSTVDLIGGFTVSNGNAIINCRTLITDYHCNVPLGSLQQWLLVYRALKQNDKCSAIEELLKRLPEEKSN